MSVKRKALLSLVLLIGLGLSLSMAWAQDDDVVKAQRILSALGFDPGIADGVLGPLTRQAIIAYQRSRNLQVTGELDKPTLSALGLIEEPQALEAPPAPVPPPAPWRTVLVYLRYYDTQPSRLLPYVTEHFRQGLQAQAWIDRTKQDLATRDFLRLSWRIEHVEPQDPEAASEATVTVYSRVRIAGEEIDQREIFSLVRADEATWLINGLQRLAVNTADPTSLKSRQSTADR